MSVALLLALLAQDRSLYVWETKPEAAILTFCAERKVTRLYLMVPEKRGDSLRAFVRAAREAKVQVHAMHPGDMADWLDPFPAKFDHQVVVDWVAAVVKEGIYDGIHLDIEPHSTKAWKEDKLKVAAGYLELLKRCRQAAGKLPLSAAIPDNWDRDDLKVDGRLFSDAVQDLLDWVSIMSYHGKNAAKVLESIEHECRTKPGKVELIQETDPKAIEDGVPLYVGSNEKLEEVFKAAREKYGEKMSVAIHHYATWRELK